MKNEINIITVLNKGEFRGRNYVDEDVSRLHNSLVKHMRREVDWQFYVLTNDIESHIPGTKIELRNNWPGWWAKIELFRSDLPRPLLFIDLDSFLVGDVSRIFVFFSEDDIALMKTKTKKKKLNKIANEGRIYRYRSGCMLLNNNKYDWVYDKFRTNAGWYINQFRGDEDVLGEWLPEVPTLPDGVVSKLEGVIKQGKLRDNCLIVTGDPRGGSFREIPLWWLEELAYD